ncbi:putative meiosis-specific topoisomerase Spo11 [Aspergillus candidus]|uniref:DNA topoisomerase (ATP-hydrolyzing) n=1 Tax=Aspergillus candidus TaxID=41067 RepID=A0A2I2EYD5_ASPCN|nr:DNA topoisomerase IV, alpha subunit [Aspergillus candidus]PLB33391.1 DNA topoisomerase IV, alpha subunit [Aspergillus candidus]
MDQTEPIPETHHQERVRKYIDDTLAGLLNAMSDANGNSSIALRRRSGNVVFYINPDSGALETTDTGSLLTYSWPGKDCFEAWRFTITLRLLTVIADAIDAGLVVSKRDIYYSDPVCFGSQRVVDVLVDDIAYTIGVNRASLNVEASAKGLVAGQYRLIHPSAHPMEARLSSESNLVPRMQEIMGIDTSDIDWVLAVYRRLVGSGYHNTAAAGKGILITVSISQFPQGKGYPDYSTRAFIRKLFDAPSQSQSYRRPQFLALVDGDPDGLAILATYKYGSMAAAHENRQLNVRGLRCLGLHVSDVVSGADPCGDDALMRLTVRDRRKIVTMLCRNPVFAVDGPELGWRAELQRMLMLNVKAEIEILYDREGGLEGWIDRRMEVLS